MPESDLKLPYPRPQSLSDPFHDHTPDRLESLLATPDDNLKWYDFRCLLGPFLPAGAYEESAYFLPLAFDYICSHDDDSFDLISSLVWFISQYASQLRRDDALDAARLRLKQCLDYWTSRFTVNHFVREAWREKVWGLYDFDYVSDSETIMQATNDLIDFKTHEDMALTFFANLAGAQSDPFKSAWFLECTRAHLCRDVYRPAKRPEIRRLLDDEKLGIKHSRIVRDMLPSYDPESTYWQDTFTLLGTVGDM